MQSRFILNLLAVFLLLIGLVLGLIRWLHLDRQAPSADAQDLQPTGRPEGQRVPSPPAPWSYATLRQ